MSKVALIIGGTGGIGRATSRLFTEKGIRVYATYFKDGDRKEGAIKCDIRKEQDVKKVLAYIAKREAKLDIVVNSATSPLKLKLFEQLTREDFKEDLDVIVLGAFNVFRQSIPFMKKSGQGIIVNLLTAAIEGSPPPRMSSYVVAKSGLLGLTKSLSVELAAYNIKVIGLSPSFVETDLIKAFPSKLLEIERAKRYGKIFLKPQDVAEVIYAIVNNPKRYVTGSNIVLYDRKDAEAKINI